MFISSFGPCRFHSYRLATLADLKLCASAYADLKRRDGQAKLRSQPLARRFHLLAQGAKHTSRVLPPRAYVSSLPAQPLAAADVIELRRVTPSRSLPRARILRIDTAQVNHAMGTVPNACVTSVPMETLCVH